jgi:hypothetical protein
VAARSFESAEAAGDLQTGFDHPEGALGFVVELSRCAASCETAA